MIRTQPAGAVARRPRYKPTVREYAACYALYLALLATGLFTVLVVWREAVYAVLLRTMADAYGFRLAYMATMVVASLALFVGVFAAEMYLRGGLRRREFRRRLVRLAVPLGIALVAGLAVQWGALAFA